MKVLKFFKRLSVFDKIILATVIILGVTFFLFFYRKAVFVQIRVKVTDQDVLYQRTEPKTWYAHRFEVGDVERDALGRIITEIVSVERFNVDSKAQAVYVDLRVRAVYDTRTKTYSARGKNLVFGAPMRFNLSYITFDGFVTEPPNSADQKNVRVGTATVRALGRSIEPALAQALRKGDKVFDSNDVLLADIIDVAVTPAETVTQTDSGDLLLRLNPLYKDLTITAKVRTKTFHKYTFIFDNLPLIVGETLPLNFNHVSIFPIITEVLLNPE